MSVVSADRLEAYLRDPVALIAGELVLPDGRTYGDAWEGWQRGFFRAIFASRRDGAPKHRLVYSERRRGESKSEDCAAALVADILTAPPMSRDYAVAADQDQAQLIIDSIRGFKSRSPILADIDVGRSVVTNPHTGSELRVMSSDAPTAYGIRPRIVVFDELSLQTDEQLWLAMWSSVAKSASSQMVAVSMAGWDYASVGWRVREAARTTSGYYFHSREGSKLAPWLSPQAMAEQEATLHPADFARLWLCRWVEPKGSFVTREMYDRAVTGHEASTGDGASEYVGFVDVGLVRDATAVALVHRDGERVILDTLRTLQGSKNRPVELATLEALVIDLTQRFKVRRWVFEAPQAVASVQRLQTVLPRVRVESRYPTAETQAKLWGALYQLLANERLVLFAHERLRREVLNLHLKTVGGRLKVVDSAAIHQDHALAVAGAADIALEHRMSTAEAFTVVLEHRQHRAFGLRVPECSLCSRVSTEVTQLVDVRAPDGTSRVYRMPTPPTPPSPTEQAAWARELARWGGGRDE